MRLGRNSEHGLKMIITRATAGDAIWFKATIDRIADILAQPAQALRLLCQHQDDDSDGPEEPADLADELDPTSSDEANHRSLQITPPPLDPAKARPRAIVYVHLSEEALSAGRGLARVEEVGPVRLSQLHMILGDHCSISVKPVIDLPAGHTAVDAYEIPASLREQILLRNPADVFPHAAAVSRSIDIDHTIPYLSPDKGGPPGQSRLGNVGPHIRYHHRIKTHGGWQVCQPEPGIWLWRSPHHRIYLVNASGTQPLGDSQFAQAIWRRKPATRARS